MSNDFQNAYDLSRMEYRSNCQSRELEALLIQGRYVIANTVDICCKFTDAVIACETVIFGDYGTREEAEAVHSQFWDGDGSYIANPTLRDPDPEVAYGPFEESPF